MGSIFCGKGDARAVLVLYKYCRHFRSFVGICFNLLLTSKVLSCCRRVLYDELVSLDSCREVRRKGFWLLRLFLIDEMR